MKDVSIDTYTSAVIPRKNMKITCLVLQINTEATVSDAFKYFKRMKVYTIPMEVEKYAIFLKYEPGLN